MGGGALPGGPRGHGSGRPQECSPSGCRGRCACPRARPRAQLLFKGPVGHVARTQLAAAGQELRGWAASLRLRSCQRAAPDSTGPTKLSSPEKDEGSYGRGGTLPGKRPGAGTPRRAGPPPPRGLARSGPGGVERPGGVEQPRGAAFSPPPAPPARAGCVWPTFSAEPPSSGKRSGGGRASPTSGDSNT